MPNATDQPTDGTRRGTFFVLVLAAAVAVGLWYLLDRPEAPIPTEGPGPTEPASDVASATDGTGTGETGVPRTADSGTTSSEVDSRATDAGTADPKEATQSVDAGGAIQVEEPGPTETESGTRTGVARTTDGDAAAREEEPGIADSGTETPIGVARTTDGDAAAREEEPGTADSGTEAPTHVAQTTDNGAAAQPGTADSDVEAPTDIARTTDDGAATQGETPNIADVTGATQLTDPETPDASGHPQSTGTDSAGPTDAVRTADSDTTGDAQQLAPVEPTAVPAKDDLVLAAAPEATVEKSPIAAPPAAETAGATGILAALESAVERIESAIQERLGTESQSDADTKLRVQVTYDDSQADAAQDDGETEVTARTTESDSTTPADDAPPPDIDVATGTDIAKLSESDNVMAPTTESDASTPADDTPAPESDVATGTDIAKLSESDNVTAPATQSDAAPSMDDAPTPESDIPTGADIAKLPESDGAAPSDVTRPADTAAAETEAEAKEFVETLTDTAPETIAVDKADHFVTQERVISLVPDDAIESVSVAELARDETLSLDTPITVVREVEQIEPAVPEQLIAESGGDLDKPLRFRVTYDDSQDAPEPGGSPRKGVQEDIVEQITVRHDDSQGAPEPGGSAPKVAEEDVVEQITARHDDSQGAPEPGGSAPKVAEEDVVEQITMRHDDSQGAPEPGGSAPKVAEEDVVEQITVREALERIRTEPKKPLSIIKTVRYFEVMTLRELLDAGVGTDTFLNVVTRPYRVESATLAELLQRHKAENPDSIFYVHTVQPTDEQGIWGIVQFGLIDNFARGMAIRHGKDIETYTVRIPRDADERLEDQSSSFLGKLIDRKTKDSYVYNFRENRMGRNPDRVYPGQEIVIINFEPEELRSIYRHFARG